MILALPRLGFSLSMSTSLELLFIEATGDRGTAEDEEDLRVRGLRWSRAEIRLWGLGDGSWGRDRENVERRERRLTGFECLSEP